MVTAASMPERIQIGARPFRIVSETDAMMRYEHEYQEKCWGAIQFKDSTILIDPTADTHQQRTTLLHEAMHGCNAMAGFFGIENEEKIVKALAYSLLDTLRRNPALVAYLTSEDE